MPIGMQVMVAHNNIAKVNEELQSELGKELTAYKSQAALW